MVVTSSQKEIKKKIKCAVRASLGERQTKEEEFDCSACFEFVPVELLLKRSIASSSCLLLGTHTNTHLKHTRKQRHACMNGAKDKAGPPKNTHTHTHTHIRTRTHTRTHTHTHIRTRTHTRTHTHTHTHTHAYRAAVLCGNSPDQLEHVKKQKQKEKDCRRDAKRGWFFCG